MSEKPKKKPKKEQISPKEKLKSLKPHLKILTIAIEGVKSGSASESKLIRQYKGLY